MTTPPMCNSVVHDVVPNGDVLTVRLRVDGVVVAERDIPPEYENHHRVEWDGDGYRILLMEAVAQ